MACHNQAGPVCLEGAHRDEILAKLQAGPVPLLEAPLLPCQVDSELARSLFGALAAGATLRLAHNDLSSGTTCEQRIFDLRAQREDREREKAYHQKKRSDSSKEKDFARSAQMRREALEGQEKVTSQLEEIDRELGELDTRKVLTPWYQLFTQLENQESNTVRHLDLSNCGLHTTALSMLVGVLLELEQRAAGDRVEWLALDGNDIGDIGMGSIASLLRLTSSLEALQLRNVGITDVGVSQVLSGLVANKSVLLVDLRNNGLSSREVTKAAVAGMQRFNSRVTVMLD